LLFDFAQGGEFIERRLCAKRCFCDLFFTPKFQISLARFSPKLGTAHHSFSYSKSDHFCVAKRKEQRAKSKE
jgi:hypothetical protein